MARYSCRKAIIGSTQVALPGFPALRPRPRKVTGETHRIETPLGTAFVTVNMDQDGEPLEAFRVRCRKDGTGICTISICSIRPREGSQPFSR